MTRQSCAAAPMRTKITVAVVSRKELLLHTQILVDSIDVSEYVIARADTYLLNWARTTSEYALSPAS